MMKRLLPLFLFFFLIKNICAQDYFEYQRIFNRIDNDLFAGDTLLSIKRLDSVDKQYSFIFARHCFKGLQICCTMNDSTRIARWLERSFLAGVPIFFVRNNGIASRALSYSSCEKFFENYNDLHARYNSSIDLALARKIDSLIEIDQKYTRRVNDGFIPFRYTIYALQWVWNNHRQAKILNKIIETKGFPGEKLIGLPPDYQDSSEMISMLKRIGPEFLNRRATTMFIHYYSRPRKKINEKMIENVRNGNMAAKQFGYLNDFAAKYGRGNYQYYNCWHRDPDKSHLTEINARRQAIGLMPCAELDRNDLVFSHRRNNLKNNISILLE